MRMFNSFEVEGNLTQDPKKIGSGENSPVVCRIAANDGKDRDGNQIVEFIDVKVFGKQASAMLQYAGKGTRIKVIGHLANGKPYEKNGEKVYPGLEALCDRWAFAGGNKKDGGSAAGSSGAPADTIPPSAGVGQPGFDELDLDDGELPF